LFSMLELELELDFVSSSSKMCFLD